MPNLILNPELCLQDEKIKIEAVELEPLGKYTLSAHLEDSRKNKFFSYAHFISNRNGVIDVCEDESVGGHYVGVFQMGLLASLQPIPSEYKYLRLFKRDIEVPNKVEFRLYEGHRSGEEICSSGFAILHKRDHFRHFMGPGVTRKTIREGRVRGSLFLPAGPGPFPGVIDMFGTAQGLLEFRSAQLASRGVASLALAYFGYEDLPENLTEYDLQYFEEAVQVLLSNDKIMQSGVGAIGVSKGGDLALAMATFLPRVACAIVINGSTSPVNYATKIGCKHVLPPQPMDVTKLEFIGEMASFAPIFPDPGKYPQTVVPFHASDAALLFIVGGDDLNLNSKACALYAHRLMRNAGKAHKCKVCIYEGAGHLIEPPYSPHCFASYHKSASAVLAWGGDLKSHTRAQEMAWPEMIEFIHKHVSPRPASKL